MENSNSLIIRMLNSKKKRKLKSKMRLINKRNLKLRNERRRKIKRDISVDYFHTTILIFSSPLVWSFLQWQDVSFQYLAFSGLKFYLLCSLILTTLKYE